MEVSSETSVTLIRRLQQTPADQGAWHAFVDRYGPRMHAWCRCWHMQQSDADDVVQNVLCTLARKFVEFQYDPSKGSFRGWLRKLVYHAWSDVAQARGRAGRGTGDSDVIGMLNRVEVRDDLVQRLEAEYDMERLEMAKQRVRVRVEPHTWAAFECTAIEGLSGADTAIKLGMKVANIYVARSSVQRMLKDEIDKLE